jgi:hypothetical protein
VRLWRDSLVHERVFGAYVAFTLIRLVLAVGFLSPHTLVYGASLAVIVLGTFFTRRGGSLGAWRARLAIYPILMNVLFVNMRWVSPLINDGKKDSILWELDRLLVGGSLSVMLEPLISPLLTELMCFCYMFFMAYLAVGMVT